MPSTGIRDLLPPGARELWYFEAIVWNKSFSWDLQEILKIAWLQKWLVRGIWNRFATEYMFSLWIYTDQISLLVQYSTRRSTSIHHTKSMSRAYPYRQWRFIYKEGTYTLKKPDNLGVVRPLSQLIRFVQTRLVLWKFCQNLPTIVRLNIGRHKTFIYHKGVNFISNVTIFIRKSVLGSRSTVYFPPS